MPVSNPSYFPDQRGNGSVIGITAGRIATGNRNFLALSNAGNNSTIDDLIVIGANSADGAMTDNADLAGSIVIGNASWQALTVGVGTLLPIISLGPNIAPDMDPADSCVTVGSNILNKAGSAHAPTLATSVMIGHNIGTTTLPVTGVADNVLIGVNILTGPGIGFCGSSQLIGNDIAPNAGATDTTSSVLIGSSILPTVTFGIANSVYIGAVTDSGTQPSNNVVIGSGARTVNTVVPAQDLQNTVVGATASVAGQNNIVLGAHATFGGSATGSGITYPLGNVVIGSKAGASIVSNAVNNVLLIESATDATGGGTVKSLIYGSFLSGNLILGTSLDGTNRDFQGTNTVKLLNGAIGGANPIGGGYFYVVAGALHWVGSAGSDTVVAPA